MYEIETYGRRQNDDPNSTRALEGPITRFVVGNADTYRDSSKFRPSI